MNNFVTRFSLTLLSLLLLESQLLFAQVNYTGTLNNSTGATSGWVKAGTLTIPQGGFNASIRFYGGRGFNALIDQMGFTEFFFRTSNGSSLVNGFPFSAYASRTGRAATAIDSIKIVPNVAGGGATSYVIYFENGSYIGSGFYQVTATTGSWTHNMTPAADPGASAFNVPFESRTLNDTYLANSLFVSMANGNVGIGTSTPKAKLAVYGDILATKVKVTQTGWPDYVFEDNYHLPDLSGLEQYIAAHKHLPGIPSAKEISNDGLDLGDMDKELLRKIEELSLYIIRLDKKNKELEERLRAVEDNREKKSK
jgi:hypothetical protein